MLGSFTHLSMLITSIFVIILGPMSALSFNQPKFCPNASWNPNATTFANSSVVGTSPHALFIDTNNTIFMARHDNGHILIWRTASVNPTTTLVANLSSPWNLFVTSDEQIFADNGFPNNRVDRWTSNGTRLESLMSICSTQCYGIFVDVMDNLYCSQNSKHQVVRRSLLNPLSVMTIVAGRGCWGSTSDMLIGPQGIFVTINLDLYVADCGNNRVQFFRSGQMTGTTAAGQNGTITLSCPMAIVLDADGYLFIVDSGSDRILGSGPGGFRCVVGCSGQGSSPSQLSDPMTMSFDRDGNIFVTDYRSNRIEKFFLSNNSCASDGTTNTATSRTAVTNSITSASTLNVSVSSSNVQSFNQPKLCPEASWTSDATTFGDSSVVGISPHSLFINTNNTIFTARYDNGTILIWRNTSVNPTTAIVTDLSNPLSLFVTGDEQIFADNGNSSYRVDRWTSNGTRLPSPMSFCAAQCSGLFVDVRDNLYCARNSQHQVVRRTLLLESSVLTIVAGTGCAGSAADMLNQPRGIFVTIDLDLYVADCGNDRVQLFRSGQMNATTVVGNGSNETIVLRYPSGITMDADGYLFIVDQGNHRIVGSGPSGFRCVVGCSSQGSSPSQLNNPRSMSFDRDGNLFVMDQDNHRIQKFLLSSNTCASSILSTDSRTDQSTSTSMLVTTEGSINNQSCFAPRVTLIPSTSNLSFPLQFRRSEDFYLTAAVDQNCNRSFSTKLQWLINICSLSSCPNSFPIDPTLIIMTKSELFIPARTLPYGIYELKLNVTTDVSPNLRTSKSAFVRITPSDITANLAPFGTSLITRGSKQDLQLNPGLNSLDLDEDQFNASDWNYQYFCRIYGVSNFPNLHGVLLPIEDSHLDPWNPSCLNNRSVNASWRYEGVPQSLKSSLLIVGGSLLANRTYQWMVTIDNKRNRLIQSNNSLLVQVEETFSQLIVLRCVMSTMCVPNTEYQRINPTTQVALFSVCLGNCSTSQRKNLTWNIYQGSSNASQNITRWTLFTQTNLSVFGAKTENFTATSQLFLSNPSIDLWRFEVVYSFAAERSSSSLNFFINQPPRNGSCSIQPENGTTTTPFTISCPDWFDEDEIKDYSLYSWSTDRSLRTLIAFSQVSIFEVYLPAGRDSLDLLIEIRDRRDCLTEWTNLSSITVRTDPTVLDDLMKNLVNGLTTTSNPFIQLLIRGSQNQVGQLIDSLSQQITKMDEDNLHMATSNGIPASTISISSVGSSASPRSSTPLNLSALAEFEKELNIQAGLRACLTGYLVNLPVTHLRSIQIQSTVLTHLTQSTNQLTRSVLTLAADRSFRLATALNSLVQRISREDLQLAANQLLRTATNLLTAVNGPLQARTKVLQADLADAQRFSEDYQTDLESEFARLNLMDDQSRNLFYQEQVSRRVSKQMNAVVNLLTGALNIHLNVEQEFTMNTSNVFMSLETLKGESLLGREIQSMGNARFRFSSRGNLSIDEHQSGSLRSTLEPLPSFGSSSLNTNLSRSISLTWMDQQGNEIAFRTDLEHPFEIVIPRDPSLIIPTMSLYDVTGQRGFHFHSIDLNQMSSSVSIHWEIHPLNVNLSYAFIYRFDRAPILNSSQPQIDGWTIFSPSNLSNESLFTYFLDNEQTSNHRSVIFALRQLNDSSLNHALNNEHVMFTADYELRLYTSSCFYFDEKAHEWKSDGMKVGPETNHFQTQCLSTHV